MSNLSRRETIKMLALASMSSALPFGRAGAYRLFASEEAAAPAQAFALDQVTLRGGPFKEAQDAAARSLLTFYEPDRLLAGFRAQAGLKPKASAYGGWEARSIAGHSLGHHLSAVAQATAVTGEKAFQQRADYLVSELAAVQEAQGDGYLGAFEDGKRIFEDEIARGDIRSQGFDLNGLWVPLYTHHKVLAGLRDAHRLAGSAQALTVGRRFADWLYGIFMPLSHDQMQQVLACEHGGMSEVLADLYADTGEARYLRFAERFYHEAVMDPLLQKEHSLPGLHANTQIPKMTGLARLYELTEEEKDEAVASFFWERVVHHHTYVTGGNGYAEHFGPADELSDRLGPVSTETCNVYNMLKLSAHLFAWAPSAATADFMERAMLNHSLSSQNPETGHVIYNLSLEMGGRKNYQDPHAFTCCVGTGMEHHLLYGRYLYFHAGDALYVNQFADSEVRWPEQGATLRQETAFPDGQISTLTWHLDAPAELELRLRRPRWADEGLEVTVNGEAAEVEALPSGYLALRRTWEDGDHLEVAFPFTLRLEAMPDNAKRVAAFYGPLALAGDLGPGSDPNAEDLDYVPVLITNDRPVEKWLRPVGEDAAAFQEGAGSGVRLSHFAPEEEPPNTFQLVDVGAPRDVRLRPFYTFTDRRYTVYWDVFTEAEWTKQQAAYAAARAKRKRLEARTVDAVQPGAMQAERDHNFQGEQTETGSAFDRKYRHALEGGWFAFEVAVLPDQPVELRATYWGDEGNKRVFDVLVDGQQVATQTLLHNRDRDFFDVTYPVPEMLTQGKEQVTVRFQARPNMMAGGLFGLRVLKEEAPPEDAEQ